MPPQILISIHDVTPRHFARVCEIVDLFDELGIGAHFSMLVVPDFWNAWPLADHPEFCKWLRGQANRGVEMILHGYTHLDESKQSNWKTKHLTAGEGELCNLTKGQAIDKIKAGEKVLHETCNIQAKGFCAPAWLYSEQSKTALQECGYLFAEDHMHVWSPQNGNQRAKGPVISYASRSMPRILSSLLWSRVADWALRPLPVLRLAIHPHDFDIAALRREITRMLQSQLRRRTPIYYQDLFIQPKHKGN